MIPPLPPFLQRRWRLHEARRAILRGDAERALAILREPALCLSPDADRLRERCLEHLCRAAAERHRRGRERSVLRLLRAVAAEDPARALRWRRDRGEASAVLAGEGGASSAPRPGARRSAEEGVVPAPLATRPADAAAAAGDPRFLLGVDDGGELLVVPGDAVVLGHPQSGAGCDLPLLADVAARHARLARSLSFHGGPTWSVEPLGGEDVRVNGRALEGEACGLLDGDEVRLARGAAFRFRLPEPASASVVLELEGGLECCGAGRVLLFAPGDEGRVRVGPRLARHVPVAELAHDVALVLEDGRLRLACAGGLRLAGEAPDAARPGIELASPPRGRVDVWLDAGRPPRALSLRPLGPGGGPGRMS